MGVIHFLWSLNIAALFAVGPHSPLVLASPSINVALKTSFNSPPYLLELLETAADENATSYFPLLDRIANGHFATATTDRELYESFIKVLHDDGHIPDAEGLSLYQLALSLRSPTPRIECHYQYYETAIEPSLELRGSSPCPVWVLLNGIRYCSSPFDEPHGDAGFEQSPQDLPFDRIVGNTSAPASVLYADITSPLFGEFHKTLIDSARKGKISYRVRHRKPMSYKDAPLIASGYGVELALKRTDYIVIDDRNTEEVKASSGLEPGFKLEDQDVADLKPLSASELVSLSLKASSFILQSENPLYTLIKISQDFPRYSTVLAARNVSTDFLTEHRYNRAHLASAGMNVLWINGIQIIERQVDAFTLLDIIRCEREIINSVRQLGLTSPEAINLLSHPKVKSGDELQRFDWRDKDEGENVIIWLNNIEKDSRYKSWPSDLNALLQRLYPGQLPSVRRDIFNLVLPVDLSNPEDIELVVEQIQNLIKRRLPLRFGIVPLTKNPLATEYAKVIYHLLDAYGLSTAMEYLQSMLAAKETAYPNPTAFQSLIKGRVLRKDKDVRSLADVLVGEEYIAQVINSKKWVARLSADSSIPPFFINGAAYPRNENWLQLMGSRVNMDLQAIQRSVFEEAIRQDDWVPSHFLVQAATRRNLFVIPEDEKDLKIYDMNKLYLGHQSTFKTLPLLQADTTSPRADWVHMILIADLSTLDGQQLLKSASQYRASDPGIEMVIVHNSRRAEGVVDFFQYMKERSFRPLDDLDGLSKLLDNGSVTISNIPKARGVRDEAEQYWIACKSLVQALDLQPGQKGIVINGRLVGPIPSDTDFIFEDLAQLMTYERSTRISPAYGAIEDLGLSAKITSPLAGAKISSIVATSTISDAPEGIFEQPPTLRISSFNIWKSEHTAIKVGDASAASIRITAMVDPSSSKAQRWIPILKVLSELDGVYLQLFLNPTEQLLELPIKRFYRYILDSKPKFNENGSLHSTGASFNGVPQEALLTLGLDVPPPWLVTPKESVYDLDNIKLSSANHDINALYEVENILIEGHSREVPGGAAPRGVQLVLGTKKDPHFADTIIMANIGYFQFKANPGFYSISLQAGRSSEIFQIDSLGSSGWSPVPGDKSTEVALMSFQGTTLYPRLSRKRGQEIEDVLETKTNTSRDFVSQGLRYAENVLGLLKGKGAVVKAEEHAEINIFSVASGHLYERMLNIMMVSVMKYTNSTVKFWFIEQFLSPSFKDFIPNLAAEYDFQYEMVTYKWPHWLRAQSEKQREIWGYKILFLDVLFPLSLGKVIFVDADQIVRTDMIELVNLDLKGAPYGFTPMCDSRTEMEGFRFWKQGYWKNYLQGLPYHISALYVVDLHRFRQIAAGDRLRQQYHQLSADPGSLSNLDQDLPNHMQMVLPIYSLPQEWLWCETWCSDESLRDAKTIDLCNNPLTKEPKLDRARRQVPEWTVYDDEITALNRRRKGLDSGAIEARATQDGTGMENTASRSLGELPTSRIIDEL